MGNYGIHGLFENIITKKYQKEHFHFIKLKIFVNLQHDWLTFLG